MSRLGLIPLATLLLFGCGGCGGTPPRPGGMGLTLGTSAEDGTGFLPLSGDQPLVPGSQGGFHVWLKYRISGMAEGKVRIKRTARRVSDHRLLLTTDGVQEVGQMGEEGYWELPAPIPSFMCPSPLGVVVQDQPAVFNVVITDEQGRVLVEDTAEATPRCPEGDQADFCRRICNG